jgi:hypothetical protein
MSAARWDMCQGYGGPFAVARVNGHGLMVRPRKDRRWTVHVDRDVLPGTYATSAEAKAVAEAAANGQPA